MSVPEVPLVTGQKIYSSCNHNESEQILGKVQMFTSTLHYTFRLCHLPGEQDERHPMNQTILINYGILDIVFDLLYQEVDIELLVKMFVTNLIAFVTFS